MLKESNEIQNEIEKIDENWVEKFKEEWTKVCNRLKGKVISEEPLDNTKIFKNRPNSHSINYLSIGGNNEV